MNEILIFGDIGWDINARDVDEKLAGFDGEPVKVRINSGGGDVYEGIAILNSLRGYAGDVTVVIESLAASAASFIAAGVSRRVVIRPNAEVMVHKAWTMMSGNADDIDKTKEDLDRQDLKIARVYAERTGESIDFWLERMSAETWFSAEEALSAGLVDAIEGVDVPVASVGSRRVFNQFRFANRAAAPPPRGPRQESGGNNNLPSSGREGETMNFLNKLAQMTGKDEAEVLDSIAAFIRNEAVEVTAPVTVEYPDEVEVVPTGKVEVAPSAPLPAGVVPEVAIGEGFTAEAAEDGTVTVRATDQVAVDDVTDLLIEFGETTVTVSVKVVAADSGEDEAVPSELAPDTGSDTAPGRAGGTAEFGEVPPGYALVPQSHLDDLTARAQMGNEAYNAKLKADREAEVDGWIKEGRFAVAKRDEVIKSMEVNPELTRKTWGSLPVNSIPRGEIGYGVDPHDPEDDSGKSTRWLIAKANSKKNNKF
ncbi:head maturation protease, ClpP-related [Corynebacterium cystitidis]|uniref:head maturation protease, ClpP-related n=1 Tax=Corynebacterium cystitidis TaxID=35757 RepID=UPI00211ED324|nr:head maturation protease, ClpP-related [Corynebacterium cystitidis]